MEELRRNCMTWLERSNPLRGLSISRAGTIYDNARVWGSPWLQYVFNEIEQTDPVLMTCVERRASALAGLERKFVARASSDKVLADEQRDALDRFVSGIDNFADVLEHLDGAFFQGFAHVQPIWDGEKVHHCSLLKGWNFLRDDEGRWLWNPNCRETPHGLETVEGAYLVSLARKRFIDWPCLNIYIRKALGHRDYGRFIERHGVPHAVIIMPPGTDDRDKPKYIAAASRWQNGQDIALPAQSSVNLAAEARGADPFTPFIELQDKYTVLLSTGGTLTSLAQSDTGSLAGGAHMEVWREIVARDGVSIAEALNRCLFRRYLEIAFPGRPVAAEFQLSNEKEKSAEEVAELNSKLKTGGYQIVQDELQEAVGFTLEKVAESAPQLPFGAPFAAAKAKTPFKNAEKAFKNAQGVSDGQGDAKALKELVGAFSRDLGPAAKEVEALLKAIDDAETWATGILPVALKEKASALIDRLPSLLPADPEGAAILAEAMAGAFGSVSAAPRGEDTTAAAKEDDVEFRMINGHPVPIKDGKPVDEDGNKGSADKSKGKTDAEPDEVGYTKEQREKIGQVGTWKNLGLPAMRDIPADPPIPLNKIEESRKRIETGEQVTNPFGETLDIDKRCLSHIDRKGRNPEQLKDKLQSLDAARETFEHPHEIWHDENNPKNLRSYVRITLDPTGRRVVNGVDERVDHVLSWHTNDVSFDHYRKGKLLWIRN